MRKITVSVLAAVFFAVIYARCCGISVCAGSIELEITPRESNGDELYAVQYDTAILMNGLFDPRTMTPDSQVTVEFDCAEPPEERCAVELIWQSWGSHSTPIKNWSVIQPSEYSDDYAVFDYADIVSACGTDNFAEVYTVLVRDTGRPLTVTRMTVSNLDIPEDIFTEPAETEPEPEPETEPETVPETEASSEEPATQTETAPAVTEAPASSEAPADVTLPRAEEPPVQELRKSNTGLLIVLGIVMIAALIAAVTVLLRKKRRNDTRFY